MEPQEYDEIICQLAAIEAKMAARAPLAREMPQGMDAMHQAMEAMLQSHQARIQRLDAMITRLDARQWHCDGDHDNRQDA